MLRRSSYVSNLAASRDSKQRKNALIRQHLTFAIVDTKLVWVDPETNVVSHVDLDKLAH